MNTIVGKLLDVDRQARQILDEAQQYYDKTIEEISRERQNIRDKYAEKAKNHLDDVRLEETSASDDLVSAMRERFARQAKTLEDTCAQNHKLWEEELFRRVTGGED